MVLASEKFPLPAITFAEILATSDVPGGVINLLSGERAELAPHFATHMDVNAIIDGSGDKNTQSLFREGAATNLKRVSIRAEKKAGDWFADNAQDPYRILDTIEFKTAWHPVGT